MATSEAQIAAVKRYREKNYDTIGFDVPKGDRDRYKQEAARLKLSLAKFLATAAEEFIQNHAGEDVASVVANVDAGEVVTAEQRRLLEDFEQMPADYQKHIRGLIRTINKNSRDEEN